MNEENNLMENSNRESKYASALDLLFYEGQIAWQMNLLFIGLNVGIGTVIGSLLPCVSANKFLLLIFSIFGIIINVAWLGTFRRNNKYYHFRMAQARESEPTDWKLLRVRGYNFSKGQEITIDCEGIDVKDKIHRLSSFEIIASNKFAIGISIWLFIIGFSILFIICLKNIHFRIYFA